MNKLNKVGILAAVALLWSALSALDMPAEKASASTLDFKFCLTSDTHMPTSDANLATALQISTAQSCEAFVITGDLTDGGTDAQYDDLMSVMNANAHPPAYFIVGNHDVRSTAGTFPQLEQRFETKTGMPGMYYDAWVHGYHFIFLGTEQNEGSDEAMISDTQLNWLDSKLAENADYDKPIFVFIHQPLQETVSGTYIQDNYGLKGWRDGVRQWRQIKNILQKYPQAIVTSGHLHRSASLYKGENVFVNAGSTTPVGGSPQEMMVYSVYNDKVDIQARKVTTNSVVWTGSVPDSLNAAALQQDVTDANNLLSSSSVGDGTDQYPSWAAEYLQQATGGLNALLADPNATESALGEALMALRNAKRTFSASRNSVTNIGLHKPVASSDGTGIDQSYPPEQAVDGGVNFTNGWNAKSSSTGSAWIQVDLEAESKITRVEIEARPTSTYDGERKNFEIRASNDPSFATYDVLGSVGGTAFAAPTWGLDLNTSNTYRYVRYQKTGAEYVFLTEMRVFGIAKGKYPISGHVVDENNQPVGGATVTLHPFGDDSGNLGTAVSGPDGSYAISVPQLSGKYTVSAAKAPYEPNDATVIVPMAPVADADVVLATGGQGGVPSDFYVSPAGTGTACTESSPCSLLDARDKVRAVNGSMTGDIAVHLADGTYTLGSTFALSEADSGGNGYNVIYEAAPGAHPTINGAYRVTGWTSTGGGVYKASLASYGSVRPLSLYVNGKPAIRARTPNVGSYYRVKNWDIPNQNVLLNSGEIANWNHFTDVMMVVKKHWNESKLRLSSFSLSGNVAAVTVQSPEKANNFGLAWPNMETDSDGQQSYYFENAKEFLDAPGEFYIDNATNELFYMPREGENMATANVLAPRLQTIVQVAGSSLNAPVHNIQFKGLRFEGSTFTGPSSSGYVGVQAGHSVEQNMLPGGVEVKNAEAIRFERNTFQNMSASGLSLVSGTHDNEIVGNVFRNIGGNGIQVGASLVQNPADSRESSRNDSIENNYVTAVGQYYSGSVGIFAGFVDGIAIEHNEVAYVPYTGISVGWGWTGSDTALQNNRIRYNDVHHTLQYHDDGAGIYTLSKAPGTVIDANYIHDNIKGAYHEPKACDFGTQDPACYPIAGIYLDSNSSGMTVSNNVIANTPMNVHLGYQVDTLPNTLTNNDGHSQTTIDQAGIEQAYRDIKTGIAPTELAGGRTATASSTYAGAGGFGPSAAVDGNAGTGWAPAGETGSPNHWWQVDLGAARTISQVDLVTRQDVDQPSTRRNFEVRASNDPNFGTYAVLAGQTASSLPYQSTWITPVYDNAMPYRYIRIVKTVNEYFFLSEVKVFGY
ncbi:discoidin domain-containing protein [Cohnella zeiphila]|uniref:Discoidin domain-containing protein n=1 Tax=Cohnella zeiphila TaxID=2761120 RepID=A0A7X0SKY5_9BACL|nr:discoidin domain-containing protein [Cohnella zeiphila]MBB6731851.1 discoidin domain-containing protein [Cohnella zeiphila]